MDVPPLISNKNVRIIKNYDNYAVMCLKREMTPGVYSRFNVTKQSWYTIELCCTKFGYGNPGLWIATPSKQTLFYGNYFTQHGRGYLKRSFYTGDYDCLLVGILVKGATTKSGFLLEKLTVTEMPKENEKEIEENIEEPVEKKNKEKKTLNKSLEKKSVDTKVNITEEASVEFKNSLDYSSLFHKCKKHKRKTSKILTKHIVNPPVTSIPQTSLVSQPFNQNVSITISEINESSNTQVDDVLQPNNSVISKINDNVIPLITDIPVAPVKHKNIECDELVKELIYNINGLYKDIDINIDVFTYPAEDFHIYPISLGIPDEYILDKPPNKTVDFFPYKLGTSILSSYENKREQFYKDLEKSRFILISKRDFGDDDPIYYEALAKGCIPIFVDELHEYTSVFLPKEMLNGIKKVDGVNLGWIDASKFSYAGFEKISKHLLDYTRNHLTTENIANYILTVADKEIKNVLFLANSICGGDFLLQQSLIHGLKKKLGDTNVVDYPKNLTLYNRKNSNYNNEIRLGLPYGHTLEESDVSRGRINKRIENREFDLIIIMGIFTKNDRKRLKIEKDKYPFFFSIDENYDTDEIFFIDGNNADAEENFKSRLQKYSNSGVCFCKDFI